MDGAWFTETGDDRVPVAFAGQNPFGVLDHQVTLPSGDVVHIAMRVIPDGDVSEVVSRCVAGQPAACFTMAASFFSSAGVSSVIAQEVGHIEPSSSSAPSLNPNVP